MNVDRATVEWSRREGPPVPIPVAVMVLVGPLTVVALPVTFLVTALAVTVTLAAALMTGQGWWRDSQHQGDR